MKHDLVCPMTTPDGYLCCCNLIARVREDERDKWVAFYCAEIEKNGVQWEASLRQRYREGSNDGKELERQRWEADGPWFKSVVHQCCEDKATAFEQGQRDERERIKQAIWSMPNPIDSADLVPLFEEKP